MKYFFMAVIILVMTAGNGFADYQVVMTKGGVHRIGSSNLYNITVNVSVSDGVSTVYTNAYTVRHDKDAPNLNVLKAAILAALQADWDTFVLESNINDAAAFDTALTDMQTSAQNYMNQ